MTVRDQLKQIRRTLRFFAIKALIDLITLLNVKKLPKLQRLFEKIFPIFFSAQIKRARQLLPEEFINRQDQIIQGMIKNQVATILEVFFYDKLKKYKTGFVEIHGKENLLKAIKNSGNFIILSAHFGNWELIAYELADMGFTMNVVARPSAINQMTKLINSYREKRGCNVIMGNNLIESLKLLKRKKIVGLLSDLNAREWGYQVNFFGRNASFYNAPVILCERGKAPLIPAFAERQKDGHQIIRFEKPVTWPKNASMQEKVSAYVERYENAFRRRPDLWCWFHERYEHAELGRQ
jgi:KDO2-lipid IV(A) lauroyltransferase